MNTKQSILELSNKLNLINSNLTELINSDEYLLVKNALYINETKNEVDKAVSTVDDLWKKYLSLNSLFEQINNIHNQSFILFDKDEKIQKLIKETKFEIEKRNIPLEKRNLLDESISIKEVSLDDLIKVMINDFNQIKQIIFTILDLDKNNKDKNDEIENKIKEYNDLLTEKDILKIKAIKNEIINNPLMANKNFDLFLKTVKSLEDKVKEDKRLRLTLENDIKNREQKIINFENYLTKKINEISINEKLVNTNNLNFFEVKRLKELLKHIVNGKDVNDIYKKIENWDNDFLSLSKIENEKLLQIYNLDSSFKDLEGLFTALSIKFKALNSKGLISEDLFNLREDIKKILQQQKIDIQILQEYMNKYQKELFIIKSN